MDLRRSHRVAAPLAAVAVIIALATPALQAVAGPPGPAVDVYVKRSSSSAFTGQDVYNLDGVGQGVAARVKRGRAVRFDACVQNDAAATFDHELISDGDRNGFLASWTDYLDQPITDSATQVGYPAGTLDAGQETCISVRIRASSSTQRGDRHTWNIVGSVPGWGDIGIDAARITVRVR